MHMTGQRLDPAMHQIYRQASLPTDRGPLSLTDSALALWTGLDRDQD